MSGGWDDSDRRQRLPDNWPELVKAVARRAKGQCEWRLPSGRRCPRRGQECDHKINNDDHSMRNLRWICSPHHRKKSAMEGNQARRERAKSLKRPPERHPGEVR